MRAGVRVILGPAAAVEHATMDALGASDHQPPIESG